MKIELNGMSDVTLPADIEADGEFIGVNDKMRTSVDSLIDLISNHSSEVSKDRDYVIVDMNEEYFNIDVCVDCYGDEKENFKLRQYLSPCIQKIADDYYDSDNEKIGNKLKSYIHKMVAHTVCIPSIEKSKPDVNIEFTKRGQISKIEVNLYFVD